MAQILVTGCSSGIGLPTALELARANHHVYAPMRNPAGAPRLADAAAAENLPIEILTLNVDSDDSVAACFSPSPRPLTCPSTLPLSRSIVRSKSSPLKILLHCGNSCFVITIRVRQDHDWMGS